MAYSYNSDIQPPTIVLLQPANGSYLNTSSVRVEWEVYDDSGVAAVWLRLIGEREEYDSGWVNVTATTNCTFANLLDDRYMLQLNASDIVGNEAIVVGYFVVDLQPPFLEVQEPFNGSWVNRTTFVLQWYVIDENLKEVWLWNSSCWVNVTDRTNYMVVVPSDGCYSFRFRAVDRAGNAARATLMVYVDTTPPRIELVEPVPGSYRTSWIIEVSWVVEESNFSEVVVYVEDCMMGFWKELVGGCSVSVWDGNLTIRVVAYDLAGNTGCATTWVVVDTVPPGVTIVEPKNNTRISSSEVVVRWEAWDSGSGVAETCVQLDGGAWIVVNGTEFRFVELEEGEHIVRVWVFDQAGNYKVGQVRFVVVLPARPSRFPHFTTWALVALGVLAVLLILWRYRR